MKFTITTAPVVTKTVEIPDKELQPLVKAIKRLSTLEKTVKFKVLKDLTIVVPFVVTGFRLDGVIDEQLSFETKNQNLAKLLKMLAIEEMYASDLGIYFPDFKKMANAAQAELEGEVEQATTLVKQMAKKYNVSSDELWNELLEQVD